MCSGYLLANALSVVHPRSSLLLSVLRLMPMERAHCEIVFVCPLCVMLRLVRLLLPCSFIVAHRTLPGA